MSNWIPRENQSVTSAVALKAFLTDRLASNELWLFGFPAVIVAVSSSDETSSAGIS